MEELLSRIVKLPLATKAGVLVGLIAAITALNYFVLPGVSDIYTKTERAQRQYRTLQADLTKKQAIANNLTEYRREMEVLQEQLKEALTEMPEAVDMDDLLSQLASLAKKAGLNLTNIAPKAESRQGGFYYRIPIQMQVTGSYNEIAVFLDSVSKLKRIVNVNNISLGSPKMEADKAILKASYLATTFRFSGQQANGSAKGAHR